MSSTRRGDEQERGVAHRSRSCSMSVPGALSFSANAPRIPLCCGKEKCPRLVAEMSKKEVSLAVLALVPCLFREHSLFLPTLPGYRFAAEKRNVLDSSRR